MTGSEYSRSAYRWSKMTPAQKILAYARKNRWTSKNYERVLLSNTKVRAKAKNIPFDLEVTDIIIPEFCPVLGIKLERATGRPTASSPSIDKIVPSLGYVKGNIIVISYRANMIKNNATPEEILLVGEFFKKLSEAREVA